MFQTIPYVQFYLVSGEYIPRLPSLAQLKKQFLLLAVAISLLIDHAEYGRRPSGGGGGSFYGGGRRGSSDRGGRGKYYDRR